VKEAGCVGCAGCEVTAYELPPPKFNPDIISTAASFSAVSYPESAVSYPEFNNAKGPVGCVCVCGAVK
jgi:hypothetical protein